MLAIEIIFAILLAIVTLILFLDRTTPSGEACVTAIKATFLALVAVPVAAWLVASTVTMRAKRRFSGT